MTMLVEHPIGAGDAPRWHDDVIPERYARQLGLIVTTDPSSTNWERITDVEAGVFMASKYVDSKAELAKEYDPYRTTSEMVGLRFLRTDDLIGASRMSDPHPKNGIKTVRDIAAGRLELSPDGRDALARINLSRTMEIGTLALEEQYRGARGLGYVALLYAAGYARAISKGHDHVLASFDANYFRGFGRKYSFAVPLGPPKDYMGSPTVPVLIEVDKVRPDQFTGSMA
jgi:hypothetical protein